MKKYVKASESHYDAYKIQLLFNAIQEMDDDEYFVPRLKVTDKSGKYINLDKGALESLIEYYSR